ncbi:Crp/Fnr family transcriptional regulator [Intestinimonas massiliensis (ex Afouda et al. 2020)]|uniref:Crp/Fnr family transcriptional regulator n=1 Tax=Intestinimonas massiliensis (ex Afouda et al. 2020) TaxID=1673721 RepID=UPI00102F712E|nr:Crp/Fnr family transcriptional regulator [Intestinimonas massiliensis (ex Afouda et al. 2020)]
MTEYLEILRRSPLFRGIGPEELSALLDCMGGRPRRMKKGDTILSAGEPATHLGIVLAGRVQVSRLKADGQRIVMGEIRPGHLFAESFACARAEALPVTVTAGADGAVLLLDSRRLSSPCSAACSFHSRLISNLLSVLAHKNLSLADKVEYLSGRNIRERLLAYLEDLCLKAGKNTVTVPFDRQALADYLCVDRSALSRAIGQLRQEGILEADRGKFTLKQL